MESHWPRALPRAALARHFAGFVLLRRLFAVAPPDGRGGGDGQSRRPDRRPVHRPHEPVPGVRGTRGGNLGDQFVMHGGDQGRTLAVHPDHRLGHDVAGDGLNDVFAVMDDQGTGVARDYETAARPGVDDVEDFLRGARRLLFCSLDVFQAQFPGE